MNTKKTILAASVVALGLLGQPLLSQAFDGHYSERSARHCGHAANAKDHHEWGRLAERLQLTPDQRQAMRAIKDKYQPALRNLRQQLRDNHTALAKLNAADAKLPESAAAQGKTMVDMIVLRKQMRSEMDKVLTEAQRQQLSNMMDRRGRYHRHDAMGHG
jgi:Spy/CpxP family protein refolding chaperone